MVKPATALPPELLRLQHAVQAAEKRVRMLEQENLRLQNALGKQKKQQQKLSQMVDEALGLIEPLLEGESA